MVGRIIPMISLADRRPKFKRFRSSKSTEAEAEAEAQVSTLATSSGPVRKPLIGSAFDKFNTKDSGSHEPPPPIDRQARSALLDQGSSFRSLHPSPDCNNALGLHLIHEPGHAAPLDIIFVHGLGGDGRKSWSKNHDPALFWPGIWLPFEPDIGKARIFSFGYNANFRGSSRSVSGITDFAKELLYDMRFGKDVLRKDLEIGKVPIIFVVHSMGGLVVKKAYLLGQNDEEYQEIFRSISAIMFFATPHRGTNLAKTLNRILTVSLQSPKNFVADLNKGASALEELNEQFRHVAHKLSIMSFYETLPTVVGLKKILVLEKDSAVLGYPKEISRSLNADHHDVCKFASPDDSNYVSVRNALKSLVDRFRLKGADVLSTKLSEEVKDIERLLGKSPDVGDDFNFFRRLWITGTCDWLLREPLIRSWLEVTDNSRIVWYSASPGSGKSVLSSHVIKHLRDSGAACQCFFFRFDNQTKRSLGTLLRSIASQVARDIPAFRRILTDLSTEGLRLDMADFTLLWQKIFESILFLMDLPHALYWVIDALDESESPKALLDLFRSIPNSNIRILIFSRKTETLFLAFDRLSVSVPVDIIEKDGQGHNAKDICILVEKEIKHMRGSDELKHKTMQTILDRAEDNFLWARLILEEIFSCHTEDAIQETLDEIPSDMTKMYQRMELTILNKPLNSDKLLAIALLQYTVCARRSLTIKELSQALRPEFPEFLDLRRTIQDVCGQFVLVDQKGNVTMVHQTARDYLANAPTSGISINPRVAHQQLFTKTISTMLDPALRFKLTHGQHALQSMEPFVFYSATSWAYHLQNSGKASDETLNMLMKLFMNHAVLTWVHSLALIGQLEILVKASKVLAAFVNTTRKLNATKNPSLHRLPDLELLDLWIIDLVKLVGKFSKHLQLDPSVIYKLIPPFCPEKSIIHRQFYSQNSAEILVSGISNIAWNDNLATIVLPNNDRAWKIACAGQHIAVLGSTGTIFLWNSYNFIETCNLRHDEPVTAICFNKQGTKLVSYGLKRTKLWAIPSGQILASITNPSDSKAIAVVFADNGSKILIGSDDKVLRYVHVADIEAGWQMMNPALLKESTQIKGAFINSPMCIGFNGDATQVCVSYRAYPLSVWSLNEPSCIGRCRRAKELPGDRPRSSTSWFAVDRFAWNPISGHIIGIYRDGYIFKWHPVTSENHEVRSAAVEVAASSDGKLFMTSDSNGILRVWNFLYFTVIYQLSSDDLVTGLAFSPDSRRFYDLRGSSINAWESNSLTRFANNDESISDTISEDPSLNSMLQASEALLIQDEAVSALAVAPVGSLYCSGNGEGVVGLFDTRTGESTDLVRFHNYLSVSHLAWDDDGKYVAAADLGGDIIIKRLTMPTFNKIHSMVEATSLPNPKINLEGSNIHQMLFNHDSSLLLIISDDRCQVWVVEEGTAGTSITIEQGASRRWLKHPTQKQLFLGFGTHDIRVFRWHELTELPSLHFREGRPPPESETSFHYDLAQLSLNPNDGHAPNSSVSKAIITQDGRHLMVQIKKGTVQGPITKRLLIFENSMFDIRNDKGNTAHLTHACIPIDIAVKIEYPLGILSGSRVVFLDEDLWICTFSLGSIYDDNTLKRHYFIPRDWASSQSLECCCITEDGTIFCPKDDKVAIIKGSLEITDF